MLLPDIWALMPQSTNKVPCTFIQRLGPPQGPYTFWEPLRPLFFCLELHPTSSKVCLFVPRPVEASSTFGTYTGGVHPVYTSHFPPAPSPPPQPLAVSSMQQALGRL